MSLYMKYFTLKPGAKKPFDAFARASQAAMMAYADHIAVADPQLAAQIKEWAYSCAIDQTKLENGENNGGTD